MLGKIEILAVVNAIPPVRRSISTLTSFHADTCQVHYFLIPPCGFIGGGGLCGLGLVGFRFEPPLFAK